MTVQLRTIRLMNIGEALSKARSACLAEIGSLISFAARCAVVALVFIVTTLQPHAWAAPSQASDSPTSGSSTAAATNMTYDSPSAYCRAVRNAGYREGNGFPGYTGPQDPPSVVAALGLGTPVAWRCMNGLVYGCYIGASGAACLKKIISVEPDDDMVQFCQARPNSPFVPEYLTAGWASEWKCVGTKPVVTRLFPTDEQGYSAEAWHRIQPLPGPARPRTRSENHS